MLKKYTVNLDIENVDKAKKLLKEPPHQSLSNFLNHALYEYIKKHNIEIKRNEKE